MNLCGVTQETFQVMFSSKFRRSGNVSLFDRQDTEEKPGKIGNPPERLSQVIDFEIFRLILEEELLNHNKKNNAGAKPTDVVPMFKIMILQRYCNISDGHTEYQIPDRLSFRKFLGLASGDKIPDARSIRLFNPTCHAAMRKFLSVRLLLFLDFIHRGLRLSFSFSGSFV